MRKWLIVPFLILSSVFNVHSQNLSIKGTITDTIEKKNLSNAVVSLLRQKDSTLVSFTRAGINGNFLLTHIDSGQFVILVSFPRYADYMEKLIVESDKNLGTIYLIPKSKLLGEVIIRTTSAIRIKGDTTEFAADSFKVKDGATVEDLLKKLPGFTVNSKGEIIAQGKRVDKVLVDGEEFFGDDPTMATQNIGAKAVDKVQVFETKTDQQQITGLTTGNEGKTVNIKLKEDAKKGGFGKINAGTDFNKFIDSKALYNKFVGKKKISVYGTRTNINAGSLNWEDRQKLGVDNDYEYDELSGYYFSYGQDDGFNDWGLRGLPDAYTAGALFSNKWNDDRQNTNLSYRFNSLHTTNKGTLLTQNIVPGGTTYSNRYTFKNGLNQQHSITTKYEWKLDSLASIKIVSTDNFRTSHTTGYNNGEFFNSNRDSVNQSFNNYESDTRRNQTDNQLTYKQLFKKKNRQWQTVVRFGITDDANSGLNKTQIRYFNNGTYNYSDTLDQKKIFNGRSTSIGIKSTFIEPLADKWLLIFDYAYNRNYSTSERNTYGKGNNGKYETLVTDFSNNFELTAFSNTANTLLRYAGKKIKMAFGSGISAIKLNLQTQGINTKNEFNFLKITPQAQFRYTPKPQQNFSFNYRGTTSQPTINQLQPVKDNTDPLNINIGNPNLKVGFNHSFSINYNRYKVLKQEYFYTYFQYNIDQNDITEYNTIDTQGKRTYYPVNVNGNSNWNLNSEWNKEGGNKKLSFGFGINGNGSTYINFINGQQAKTRATSFSFNTNIGYDKEDKYDFRIGPVLGYNTTASSLASASDNNYFTYGGRMDASVTLPFKIEINTDINADLRQKINAFASNTNITIWNASISKKIFKKDAGRITLSATDILNQNKGFNRTINSTFISDDRYQRIGRLILLKFQWSFTKTAGEEKQ